MSARAAILVSLLVAGCAASSVDETTAESDIRDTLGNSERVCVDVDSIVTTHEPKMVGPDGDQPVFNIRSGDIVAGNFALVVDAWSTFNDGVAKIYWIPVDRDVAMANPLDVVVESLTGHGDVETITFGGDGTYSLAADDAAFWASGTRFDQPGRYRLTATAPDHWACFELTV